MRITTIIRTVTAAGLIGAAVFGSTVAPAGASLTATAATSVVAPPADAQDCNDLLKKDGKCDTQKDDKAYDIKPYSTCYVKQTDGTVVSYFGYELKNTTPINLPAGSGYNYLTSPSFNAGQPSIFEPGTNDLAFSLTWNGSGDEPKWVLNGKEAKAASSGKACAFDPVVPEFPFAIVGPVLAVALVGGWITIQRRRDQRVGTV